MEIHATTVLEDVDEIMDSPDEQVRRTRLERFRLKLNGQAPSVIIKQYLAQDDRNETDNSDRSVDLLHRKIDTLLEERSLLEQQIVALTSQLKLHGDAVEVAKNGYYSMGYFLSKLFVKMRRSYGWRTDYLKATETTPGCTPVTNETVQKWQSANRVPTWAVDQIDQLLFSKRSGQSGPVWTSENKEFLITIFTNDPSLSNIELAALCSAEFGRTITENSIKGEIDRSRKRALLPPKGTRAALRRKNNHQG
jgi:hypothetical protein